MKYQCSIIVYNYKRNHFARNIVKQYTGIHSKSFLNGSKIRITKILNDKWNFKPDSLSKYRWREDRRGTASLYILTSIVSRTSLCLGQRTVRLGGTMHRANNSPLKRFHRSWPSSILFQRPQPSSSLFFNRFSPAPRFFPLPSTTEIAT